MEEAAFCGVVVTGIMLGVPLYHSMENCRQGRVMTVHLFRWWLVCAVTIFSGLLVAILCGCSMLLLANLPPSKLSPVSSSCKILSKGISIISIHMWAFDNQDLLHEFRTSRIFNFCVKSGFSWLCSFFARIFARIPC